MAASYTLIFCRSVVVVVFLLSATGKLKDMEAFRDAVSGFRVVPANWSRAVAGVSVLLELLVCLLIIVGGSLAAGGFLLSIVLLLTFTAALTWALRRKLNVSCNCFGYTQRRVSSYDIVRNLLLCLCGAVGVAAAIHPYHGLRVSETILLALMGVCFAALVTSLGDVVETLRRPLGGDL